MKHEWERGTTPSTPHSPPEGYSNCAFCCVEEDDDNTDAECPARFHFRPLVFEPDEYSVKTVEGDVPIATLLTSADFPCASEGEEAQVDREAEFYGQLFAASPDLLKALQAMLGDYEDQRGVNACECDSSVGLTCNPCRARAAIAKVERNPFCEKCGGSGEVDYGLPGCPLDTEQSTETGECDDCEGTGRASQPASA